MTATLQSQSSQDLPPSDDDFVVAWEESLGMRQNSKLESESAYIPDSKQSTSILYMHVQLCLIKHWYDLPFLYGQLLKYMKCRHT